jgi:hypothetical protein
MPAVDILEGPRSPWEIVQPNSPPSAPIGEMLKPKLWEGRARREGGGCSGSGRTIA